MSLYYVQKFLFEFNRDPRIQEAYDADRVAATEDYQLSDEERAALVSRTSGSSSTSESTARS